MPQGATQATTYALAWHKLARVKLNTSHVNLTYLAIAFPTYLYLSYFLRTNTKARTVSHFTHFTLTLGTIVT